MFMYTCMYVHISYIKSVPGGRGKDHWGTLWAHGGGVGCLPKSAKIVPRYARNGGGEGARSSSEKGRGTEAFTIRFGA